MPLSQNTISIVLLPSLDGTPADICRLEIQQGSVEMSGIPPIAFLRYCCSAAINRQGHLSFEANGMPTNVFPPPNGQRYYYVVPAIEASKSLLQCPI
jgi:hypothetical protein